MRGNEQDTKTLKKDNCLGNCIGIKSLKLQEKGSVTRHKTVKYKKIIGNGITGVPPSPPLLPVCVRKPLSCILSVLLTLKSLKERPYLQDTNEPQDSKNQLLFKNKKKQKEMDNLHEIRQTYPT